MYCFIFGANTLNLIVPFIKLHFNTISRCNVMYCFTYGALTLNVMAPYIKLHPRQHFKMLCTCCLPLQYNPLQLCILNMAWGIIYKLHLMEMRKNLSACFVLARICAMAATAYKYGFIDIQVRQLWTPATNMQPLERCKFAHLRRWLVIQIFAQCIQYNQIFGQYIQYNDSRWTTLVEVKRR